MRDQSKRTRAIERIGMSMLAVSMAALWAGCGGSSGTAMKQCEAGATQQCTCPAGDTGRATCDNSGQWGACSCGPGDASPPDMTTAPPDMACPGEVDQLGVCCSGNDCCAAKNHSRASGNACVCMDGYIEGPKFSSTNRVCVPAKADLQVGSFEVDWYDPAPGSPTMYICLNQQSDGTPATWGDHIDIKNTGMGAAAPYHVGIGIQRLSTGDGWVSDTRLFDTTGLKPGETGTWSGPICAPINTYGLPRDYYRIVLYADVDGQIDESNEVNNAAFGSQSFWVYGY